MSENGGLERPNMASGGYTRLSCGAGDMQLGPDAKGVSHHQTVSKVLLQANRQTTKAKRSKINAAATTKMVPDFWTNVRAGPGVRGEFSLAAFIDDARPNRLA
jgi:hypothetical protein